MTTNNINTLIDELIESDQFIDTLVYKLISSNKLNKDKLSHILYDISNANITVLPGAIKPRRAYNLDAGLDIAIQSDMIIPPGKTVYAPAGVCLGLPDHLAAYVMTRSGTAKKDLTVVPTIIDANYRDEISTIISNFTNEPIRIKRGERFAQVVLLPSLRFDNEDGIVESLNKDRPSGSKHGSSDVN